jgi:hypothetical protein
VSRYALDKDSLRYAIGCSCVFAALGGCFFMRAARYLPEELARNNWTSADPGAVAAHYGT